MKKNIIPVILGLIFLGLTSSQLVLATSESNELIITKPVPAGTDLTITSQSKLAGTVGNLLNVLFYVNGGSPAYNVTLASGSLPTGTKLSQVVPECPQSSGDIQIACDFTINTYSVSGTPTAAGSFTFVLKATDVTNASVTQSFTVTIVEPGVTLSREVVVLSPLPGETWAQGETRVIKWNSNVSTTSTVIPGTVTLELEPYIACLHAEKYRCLIMQPDPYTIALNASNTGSYSWSIPKDLAVRYQGQMRVLVTLSTGEQGASGVFGVETKVSPSPTPTPTAPPTTKRDPGISFKYKNNPAVHYLTAVGCRETYPGMATFRAWKVSVNDIVTISDDEQYPTCAQFFVRFPDNLLVKVPGAPAVYLAQGLTFRPFATMSAFLREGRSTQNIVLITQSELSLYAIGDAIN